MRTPALLAALLAFTSALSAQDKPPFENPWLIDNLDKVDLARPIPMLYRELKPVRPEVFAYAPPAFTTIDVYAGRPDQDGDREGPGFYSSCLYRPSRISLARPGVYFVGQDNGEVRLLDGTNVWHWPVPSGTAGPLVGFYNLDIAQGFFDMVYRAGRGAQPVWAGAVTVPGWTSVHSLALDGHDRVWAVNGKSLQYLEAADGKGPTVVIPAGTKEPFQGGAFAPVRVAADPTVERLVVVSDDALYEVDPRTGGLRHLAGIPGSKGYYLDGPADQARFIRITGLAVHRSGWVLVVDEGGFLRLVDPAGEVKTLTNLGGLGVYHRLVEAGEVIFDGDAALVVDAFHHVVWRVH